MKIYLDNNLGVEKVEQEELTQDTYGYNILKVYIPNAVLAPYDTFTCYYGALLQNGRKVGWFAMEARTNSDADYEANYTLYKATIEQSVISVEGKVYIGCQVILGNSGNATLIKKNTAVVQFNVRKSVAINNDILILDPEQTTTDVLESYKQLLENALTTYATKAQVQSGFSEIDNKLSLKADKSTTYTKTESDNKLSLKADKEKIFEVYKGVSFLGNIEHTATMSNGFIYTKTYADDDSDNRNQAYTQIMLANADLEIRVLNSETYQIRAITMNNPYGLYPALSNWGITQQISKGTYFIIVIALYEQGTGTTPENMTKNIILSNSNYEIMNNNIPTWSKFNDKTLYFEIKPNAPITYNFGNLSKLGYSINVWKSETWDVTQVNQKELEIFWQTNVNDFTFPKGIYKIFFRKYVDNTLIDFNFQEVSESISVVERTKEKYVHISIDDCVFWKDLIDNQNTYTSIFENTTLNFYKEIHDTYGMKITLNCFCSEGGYDISNVPSKFSQEFAQNSDWLKMSFHAEDNSTRYDTDKVEAITNSYNKFIAAIYKMTKSFDCVDRFVRLGFFSGTLANVRAIRDCKCGIVGLFTADDTRISYYFDNNTNNYFTKHPKMSDVENQIEFIRTQTRLENITTDYPTLRDRYITNDNYANFDKYLEFFTHEYLLDTAMQTKIKNLCLFLSLTGYEFVYYQDLQNCIPYDNMEAALALKADKTDTYTKNEVDTKLSTKADKSDTYTKQEADGTFAMTSDIPTVNNPTITFTQGGETKGSITLNQSSDQTIALDAGGSSVVKLADIVDKNGNKRFIEGEGTPATITGMTITYNKWSLSGTHLMIVVAGTFYNNLDGINELMSYTFPDWINNKIMAISPNGEIERYKPIYYRYITQAVYQSNAIIKKTDSGVSIFQGSSIDASQEKVVFRIQFDLLIDSE